jgi:hypothetical protein
MPRHLAAVNCWRMAGVDISRESHRLSAICFVCCEAEVRLRTQVQLHSRLWCIVCVNVGSHLRSASASAHVCKHRQQKAGQPSLRDAPPPNTTATTARGPHQYGLPLLQVVWCMAQQGQRHSGGLTSTWRGLQRQGGRCAHVVNCVVIVLCADPAHT